MPVIKNRKITVSDIPAGIARDTEFEAADAAHVGAVDPHSQYEYRAIRVSKSLFGPISFPTTVWTSLGTIAGFSLGTQGELAAILIGLNFLFDVRYLWQQAVCAGLLAPIWWQPVATADSGIRVPIEIHNQSGFFINIRASQYSSGPAGQNSGENRYIEIKPESLISIPAGGRLDIVFKKLL